MASLMNSIEKDMPELLELLEESVNKDSPSRNKALGDEIANWYMQQFERLTGSRMRRLANERYGDPLIGEVGNGSERILLLGHYDTVWPAGEAAKRPFAIKDGKVYGPGVYDMKCGLLQAMFAIKVLQDLRRLPADKTIALFINSDEEIQSPSSREWIEQEAKAASAVFVLEPPMEPDGTLKTARKGSASYKMIIKGVSAHAGVDPQKGVSAIQELSYQIQRLHGLTDYETGTTVNVGIVSGGRGANVVADYAEADIDVRIMTMTEAERVDNIITTMQPVLPGASVTVIGGMTRPPMERSEEIAKLFQLAQSIGTEEFQWKLGESSAGGVSDGNFTAACGTPTLDGLGTRGDFAHSPKEYVLLEDIPRRIALLARLIERC